MEPSSITENYRLRPATAQDAPSIKRIISFVHINPMGLDWHRFILAVDTHGTVIGCGQVKPHQDGSHELASIAVLPEWRGMGIARTIIEYLLAAHPGTLYLTCRSQLESLYMKFGFKVVVQAAMPPYFKRISRLVNFVNHLTHQPVRLLVMCRQSPSVDTRS
jgi:N-acetylglutamate synthase-like GNAT family acetyltransferase